MSWDGWVVIVPSAASPGGELFVLMLIVTQPHITSSRDTMATGKQPIPCDEKKYIT